MSRPAVRAAVVAELTSRGYGAAPRHDPGQDPRQAPAAGLDLDLDLDLDLISLGVNSVTLIQILSALEDAFDIDFDLERLFRGPVTVARLEAEITALTAPGLER